MNLNDWVAHAQRAPEKVAVDPAAPPYVLLILAHDYPDLVANNRGWTLNFVTNLGWTEHLLKHSTRRSWHPAWRGLLTLLRTPPAGLVEFLLGLHDARFAAFALTHPHLSPKQREEAWRALHDAPMVARTALRDVAPFVPPKHRTDSLLMLSGDEGVVGLFPALLKAGWGSHRLHATWIDRLFEDAYLDVDTDAWSGLSRPNAERLYDRANNHFRLDLPDRHQVAAARWLYELTQTPSTPARVLARITDTYLGTGRREPPTSYLDDDGPESLATHPNTPARTLRVLETEVARVTLFENPNLPQKMGMRWLEEDSDLDFEHEPTLGPSWFARHVLVTHERWPARTVAAAYLNPRNENRPNLVDLSEGVRVQLASHTSLPEHLALRLLKDESERVRTRLALATPHTRLHPLLREEGSPKTRRALAHNENVRVPTLIALREDADDAVAHQARMRLADLLPLSPFNR